MAYEIKVNTGSLFVNEKKTADAHPDFQGKIIISAELIKKLANQGENLQFDVSGWKKTTGSGKNLLSLAIKEPYKKPESSGDYSSSDRLNPDYTPKYKAGTPPEYYAPEVIHEPQAHQQKAIAQPHRSGALVETDRGIAFTEYRQPPVPTKTPPTPEKYLAALKDKIAAIENYPDFESLSNKINSPEVWAVFATNAAIAQEAKTLLSVKKGALILATKPVDLSAIISAIDVEIARLKLPAKQHCLARWDQPRAMLTPEELQIYLDELAIAEPLPPSDDFF